MLKNPKWSATKSRGLNLFFILLLLGGCASNLARNAKKDPFSDPSKFDNLASKVSTSPLETPKPLDGSTLVSQVTTSIETNLLNGMPAPTVNQADVALKSLIEGNERFITGAVKGEHRDESRRRALAGEQNPHTIMLSCSDSRVPPELIFDQGLGDLYTIRVSGNILGSAQVASIEYAVENLGANLIVTMGHESCRAVKAALDSHPKISSGSTDIDWMVSAIRPNLAARSVASDLRTDIGTDPKLRQSVIANVDAVTEQLLVRSKIISHAVEAGKLKIVRGIYSLDSGKVDFWGIK